MKNFWSVLRQGYEGQDKIRSVHHVNKAVRAQPILVLAPLAGYTDQPMRLMCKKYGVDVLYSEMISSEAIWHNRLRHAELSCPELGRGVSASLRSRNEFGMTKGEKSLPEMTTQEKTLLKTLKLIQFSKIERPFVVQIFGSNPEHMAYAAKYIASGKWAKDQMQILKTSTRGGFPHKADASCEHALCEKMQNLPADAKHQALQAGNNIKFNNFQTEAIPDGIDINMGCPVRDVTKTGAGAALLKNPELAAKIVKAIKKEVKNIPVSVKSRLGWDKPEEILEFSKIIEIAGADALAIHGRTYRQGFTGAVDWEMIAKVKKQLKIPVIGNGGIELSNGQWLKANSLNLDGFMIGTGAIGKPWLFQSLKANSQMPNANKLFIKKNILKHAKLVQEIKGKQGIIEFRKHMAWYLKGLPDSKELKSKLVRVNSYQEIVDILSEK